MDIANIERRASAWLEVNAGRGKPDAICGVHGGTGSGRASFTQAHAKFPCMPFPIAQGSPPRSAGGSPAPFKLTALRSSGPQLRALWNAHYPVRHP